jgi:hypothetical protein
MTGPLSNGSGSPLGPWAPIVASVITVAIIAAAVADHILVALGRAVGSDAFLDSAALLVLGVVLGVGTIGSTASAALTSAQAAHTRLDEIAAPPASGPASPSGPAGS